MITFDKHITILGGGNLGISIAEGLLKSQLLTIDQLTVTDKAIDGIRKTEKNGIPIEYDNVKAVMNADIIFVCVQPKQMTGVLNEIKDSLIPDKQVIVSTVTGYSIDRILGDIGKDMEIFRAMPNTAISIRQSMTCVATNSNKEESKEIVRYIFEQLGKIIFIGEELIAAATVLASSGIAFAHRFIRAASQGGIEIGFDSEVATFIAAQTVKGAATLLLERGYHPEKEIDKVTTPQGVTISGLNEMEHSGFSSALIKGLITSFNKIKIITES